MSWDVWIINSKEKISFDDMDKVVLKDFGDMDKVMDKFSSQIPEIDWTDKTYPHLDSAEYRGNINFSEENGKCTSIMFHVYGGFDPVKVILKLCKKYDWQAIDTSSGEYLDIDKPDDKGWNDFKEFRNSIVMQKKKWWKFWKKY